MRVEALIGSIEYSLLGDPITLTEIHYVPRLRHAELDRISGNPSDRVAICGVTCAEWETPTRNQLTSQQLICVTCGHYAKAATKNHPTA